MQSTCLLFPTSIVMLLGTFCSKHFTHVWITVKKKKKKKKMVNKNDI